MVNRVESKQSVLGELAAAAEGSPDLDISVAVSLSLIEEIVHGAGIAARYDPPRFTLPAGHVTWTWTERPIGLDVSQNFEQAQALFERFLPGWGIQVSRAAEGGPKGWRAMVWRPNSREEEEFYGKGATAALALLHAMFTVLLEKA
jgi:hypothetical protein